MDQSSLIEKLQKELADLKQKVDQRDSGKCKSIFNESLNRSIIFHHLQKCCEKTVMVKL